MATKLIHFEMRSCRVGDATPNIFLY